MKNILHIYCATHKDFNPPTDAIYIPIFVGAALNEKGNKIIGDDTGDNISLKNKNFCELTALYWAWKNDTIADIMGLCHYRRFLSKNRFSNSDKHFLDENDISNSLASCDIIVPERFIWKNYSVKDAYCAGSGRREDLELMSDIIRRKCPQYGNAYTITLNRSWAFYCNVMITNRDLFGDYCTWLFDLLFELENVKSFDKYNTQEARVFGYISELLLNVWITENRIMTLEYPLVNTEVTSIKKIVGTLKSGKYYIP